MLFIEDYLGIGWNTGVNFNKPVTLSGSGATLSVGGTLAVTGASTLGALTVSGFTNTGSTVGSKRTVTNVTASTLAPTAAQSGTLFTLNRAAGITITLPTPAVGLTYTFIVGTANTGTLKWITDAGTTFLQGLITSATTTASVFQGDGATHIAVTMNGTTTGGLLGTQLEFYCLTATLWQVFGTNFTSSTTATPFATS